jgi:hypothetical protein
MYFIPTWNCFAIRGVRVWKSFRFSFSLYILGFFCIFWTASLLSDQPTVLYFSEVKPTQELSEFTVGREIAG